jgi:hypothetical protein
MVSFWGQIIAILQQMGAGSHQQERTFSRKGA